MAKGTIITILIYVGKRSYPLRVISYPDSKFIVSFFVFYRSYRYRNTLSFAAYPQCNFAAIKF